MATRRKPPAATAPDGRAAVAALLAGLDHPHAGAIRSLRQQILALDPRIREHVKWNAPSFVLDDDFATFKLHPPTAIQLVLHTGATRKSNARKFAIDDPEGLLAWAAKDRCVLTLKSANHARAMRTATATILRQWTAQL